jgi:hypothetical protein
MINNDESGRIWKGAVVALFKVLSRYFPEGTEENHVKRARIAGLRMQI